MKYIYPTLLQTGNIINSHIPYDSYDSNALSDLNTQLNNIYESNNYKKNNNNNELV